MKLIERMRYYEQLLLPVILILSNGKELRGVIGKIERDFLTFSTQTYGAIDIKLDFIMAIGPLPSEQETPNQEVSATNQKKKKKVRRKGRKKKSGTATH
jgi:hypothetical protein